MKAEPTTDDLIGQLSLTCPGRILTSRSPNVPALNSVQQSVSISLSDREAMIGVLKAAHVLDDEILTEHPPFFFGAEISNTNLDSYDTRMDPETTLVNFVQDAIEGVSFCDTHNHNELAFGRSFAASLVVAPSLSADDALLLADSQEQKRVVAAFYTLEGLKTNRVTTNDLIASIRGGFTKDVSVGFKTGPGFMYRCSICSLDLWDWDCPHIPGVVYDVTESDAADAPTLKRYAFAWIINARLSETSAAYDGATPQCMILKATREAEGGRIPARIAALVEQRCRIHLPGKRVTVPGHTVDKERSTMTPEEKLAAEKAAREALVAELLGVGRSVLVRLGLVKTGEESSITTVPDILTRMHDEITKLQPLAAEGVQLRKELVDAACVEGARAMADKFNEESQRKTLMSLDLDSVKNMRQNWEEVGDSRLGKGKGRKTADNVDATGKEKATTRAAGDDDESNDESYIDDESVVGV